MNKESATKIQHNIQSEYSVSIDDLKYILDRNTSLVQNCDNKASLVLGVIGVLLTIIFGTNISDKLTILFQNSKSFHLNIIFTIVFLAGCILLCIAILQFSLVFIARYKIPQDKLMEKRSIIFFGTIVNPKCHDSYCNYKDHVNECTDLQFRNDLTTEIYENSIICMQKYTYFNRGLKLSIIAVLIIFISVIYSSFI